ncbi:MAG: phosphonoacetaldehyde dehydrogenase [Bacteroidota bacterium]|nr:phosphonoacetaldehyde dehydrogenase [Bacteroidota bacterium]
MVPHEADLHTHATMNSPGNDILDLPCYIAGRAVHTGDWLSVVNPYTGDTAGRVASVSRAHVEEAVAAALQAGPAPSRYARYEILMQARTLLQERAESFAQLITAESGLCMRESRYEVGRSCDVLQFAAMEALKDDGQVFSCDISPQGKTRKIFTLREPHQLVVAITPFNHPLNQVIHKLAPAIACGAPVILKPSEKTPMTAIRCVELLYEAGLPGSMLSVLVGELEEVATLLVVDPRVEVLCFTGSVEVGKYIASKAGYKRLILELGGNSPLIVLDDADLDLAVKLATEGCYRNSGQRCTAVKRLLIHAPILEEFTERFVDASRAYNCGDPMDEDTRVGTVIDAAAAERLENTVQQAIADGAKLLMGGKRSGALFAPTVLGEVPRTTDMVVSESFGPLAPIMAIRDLDDAIALANSTAYGLSSGIVTENMNTALKAVRSIRTGTVNINEVPGYRIEMSPFGGVKDSGLGVKEGVIEAMKGMTAVKTFSMPW